MGNLYLPKSSVGSGRKTTAWIVLKNSRRWKIILKSNAIQKFRAWKQFGKFCLSEILTIYKNKITKSNRGVQWRWILDSRPAFDGSYFSFISFHFILWSRAILSSKNIFVKFTKTNFVKLQKQNYKNWFRWDVLVCSCGIVHNSNRNKSLHPMRPSKTPILKTRYFYRCFPFSESQQRKLSQQSGFTYNYRNDCIHAPRNT